MLTFSQAGKRIHTFLQTAFPPPLAAESVNGYVSFSWLRTKQGELEERGPTGNVYNTLSSNDTERQRNFGILTGSGESSAKRHSAVPCVTGRFQIAVRKSDWLDLKFIQLATCYAIHPNIHCPPLR